MRSSYFREGRGVVADRVFPAAEPLSVQGRRFLQTVYDLLRRIGPQLGGQHLVFLLLLSCQCLITSRDSVFLILIAFVGALWIFRANPSFLTTILFFVVGSSAPLIGRFDANALRVLALCALTIGWQKDYRAWFSHFLLLLWIGFLLLVFHEGFFWDLPWSVQRVTLQKGTLLSTGAFGIALAVTLFACLCEVFSKDARAAKAFRTGLGLGIGLAIPFLILEIAGLPSLAESSAFWSYVGRMSGTFSDPNAWGVFSLCLLPVLIQERRVLLSGFLTALSLFSGSRLLVLCVGMTVGRLCLKTCAGRVRLWSLLCLVGVGVLLCAGLLSVSELPAPLARQLLALDISRLCTTFASRTKFWRVALDVWQEWPLTGIGLGLFPTVLTSHAAALGDDMNLWIDNPNSTYLWVLAEFGIMGLLALLLGMFELSIRTNRKEHLVFGLFTVLIALQFGPHLFFVEFGILLAYLVALTVTRRNEVKGAVVSKWLMGTLFILWAGNVQYGWYGWEREGEFVQRWSAPHAQAFFPCINGTIGFDVRAIVPQLLTINGPMESQSLELNGGSWHPVRLSCISAKRLVFNSKYPWIPAQDGFPGDYRILGIQLRVSPELSFKLR